MQMVRARRQLARRTRLALTHLHTHAQPAKSSHPSLLRVHRLHHLSKDYVSILLDPNGEFIFFQCRQGPYIPTLRFLYKYPDILPKYQVDRGAVPFVLSGANIMAPGLTSAGGAMDDVPAESVVAVMVQGKEHAIAIGVTTMSTEDIRSVNKGNAVENTHWLNDGLWTLRSIVVGETK